MNIWSFWGVRIQKGWRVRNVRILHAVKRLQYALKTFWELKSKHTIFSTDSDSKRNLLASVTIKEPNK